MLVGSSQGAGGYRLFARLAGGAPDWRHADRAALICWTRPRRRGNQVARPVLAFAGADVVVAGNAGVVRCAERSVAVAGHRGSG